MNWINEGHAEHSFAGQDTQQLSPPLRFGLGLFSSKSKSFFTVMASGGLLFSYLHHNSQSFNNLCALDTTFRILITWYKLHVYELY